MQIDLEDIMAGAVGRILVTFLFLLSAVWLGSIIGATAWQVGDYGFESFPNFQDLLMSLLMQINLWIVPNVAFLAIMTVYLFVSDGIGHVAWGIIVGFESLFLMLGWCLHFEETKDTVLAWGSWLVLLAMAETGIWLHRQMMTNRWVRQMAELRAENAMLRAEREATPVPGNAEETPDAD
ncbi:MAG: hypothetical protein EOP88_05250 [Verrucomicrobiaceae bacterium]|nr:MAG: hypothetical protein EOP88_05250 [Verrucomicrobiaceae bacterium]